MPSKESGGEKKKHPKVKKHIKQLNLALHNSLNVYSLKCACVRVHTHSHTLTHIRRMHFLCRIFYVNFRKKKSGYLLVLIFKFLSKTRAWQNYRFYNFIVILYALLWPIMWLFPVVSFMATKIIKSSCLMFLILSQMTLHTIIITMKWFTVNNCFRINRKRSDLGWDQELKYKEDDNRIRVN